MIDLLSVVILARGLSAAQLSEGIANVKKRLAGYSRQVEIVLVIESENKLGPVSSDLAQREVNTTVIEVRGSLSESERALLGLENAIGEAALILLANPDHFDLIEPMMNGYLNGHDIVFAEQVGLGRTWAQKTKSIFRWLLVSTSQLLGIGNKKRRDPVMRVMSRQLVNTVLDSTNSILVFRSIRQLSGLRHLTIRYRQTSNQSLPSFLMMLESGFNGFLGQGKFAMRIASSVALFGALANVLYSGYVIYLALFQANLEPGWASLSLQISGMFFLISVVLLFLSEYVLRLLPHEEAMRIKVPLRTFVAPSLQSDLRNVDITFGEDVDR